MWQKLRHGGEGYPKNGNAGYSLSLVVVLLLVFSFVPIMKVPYEVEESIWLRRPIMPREAYTVEEPYTVMEPYTDIEVYCEEEPCEKYVPIEYLVVGGQGYNYYESDGSRPAVLNYISRTQT